MFSLIIYAAWDFFGAICMRKAIPYSYRRESTGLDKAARMD
jgi:hypothetical protein